MTNKKWGSILLFPTALVAFTVSQTAIAARGETQVISRAKFSLQTANDFHLYLSASADGRFVAFRSSADNLVPGDTNQSDDIFVYDRQADTTERVSVSSTGAQANAGSDNTSISADGRYIAFTSNASNLVPGDTNAASDVFIRDRQLSTTTRVSLSSSGAQGNAGSSSPALSADGRFVAFASDASNFYAGDSGEFSDIFVRDRQTGVTTLISLSSAGAVANNQNVTPSISANGRYVAFDSRASNLVSGAGDFTEQIYVRDRQTATTTLVSVSSAGVPGNFGSARPAISGNGRYVVFISDAGNLDPAGPPTQDDAYVHDRQTHTTVRVTARPGGEEADARTDEYSISADGRFIAFSSAASNLIPGGTDGRFNVYVRDEQSGAITRLSTVPGTQVNDPDNFSPAISADGRYVAYTAINDGSGTTSPTDIFIHDRQTANTQLATVAKVTSTTAFGFSSSSSNHGVSSGGRFVAFVSDAPNLVANDTNALSDVFVRDRQTGQTVIASVGLSGEQSNGRSFECAVSANGRYVAFASEASNLVSGDTNETRDIFVRDLQTSTTKRVSLRSNGVEALAFNANPAISGNGRFISFTSNADLTNANTVTDNIYVYDTVTNTVQLVSVAANGTLGDDRSDKSSISDDGRFVAFESFARSFFPGDVNVVSNVFVKDRQTGSLRKISVGPAGEPGNSFSGAPSISGNGRFVAFHSIASNLLPNVSTGSLQVYVRDLITNKTTLTSVSAEGVPANASSETPSISTDGRYVAFLTAATNLAPVEGADNHIVVRDRLSGAITVASRRTSGEHANGRSFAPAISGDGRFTAFTSLADNLIDFDLNKNLDQFIHERRDLTVIRINVAGAGFTDSNGYFWEADRGFNTGGVSTFTSPIANTVDDVLYQTERYDLSAAPELQYAFAVPNGTYLVRLHFAENYAPNFAIGKRVFDVDAEGALLFDNIDIFRETGSRAALVKSAAVTVADGTLNLLFRHQAQNPIIDAIEIIGQ
jgi:Tol biopolymer transport system component